MFVKDVIFYFFQDKVNLPFNEFDFVARLKIVGHFHRTVELQPYGPAG